MKPIRIAKPKARREQHWHEPLPLDPRDLDIVRDSGSARPKSHPGHEPGRSLEVPTPQRRHSHAMHPACDYWRSDMFLDCPAYLDQERAARCGLPAEVRCWFTTRSTGKPLGSAMIRCPVGHWSSGPIESLTWARTDKHDPGTTAGAPSAKYDCLQGTHDGGDSGGGFANYLGRPARLWITAMRPASASGSAKSLSGGAYTPRLRAECPQPHGESHLRFDVRVNHGGSSRQEHLGHENRQTLAT
jgi:hypothetical protein